FLTHDPATPATSPLSLHDALPISEVAAVERDDELQRHPPAEPEAVLLLRLRLHARSHHGGEPRAEGEEERGDEKEERNELHEGGDRKSTRLNSSHLVISYAVFCLK